MAIAEDKYTMSNDVADTHNAYIMEADALLAAGIIWRPS